MHLCTRTHTDVGTMYTLISLKQKFYKTVLVVSICNVLGFLFCHCVLVYFINMLVKLDCVNLTTYPQTVAFNLKIMCIPGFLDTVIPDLFFFSPCFLFLNLMSICLVIYVTVLNLSQPPPHICHLHSCNMEEYFISLL